MMVTEEATRLLVLAREGGDAHFDPRSGICLIVRDTCWYATGLLFDPAAERKALGNHLLGHLRSEDGTHTPATMIALLNSVPELLEAETAEHLRSEVRRELIHAAETEWKDGNVNHPLGAYCALVCGGELSGERWAVELGARRLIRMLERVGEHRSSHYRQAELSEYNSLTYTALSLCFLALMGEYARHEEARRAALRLEEGLWIDASMHFHGPSQQFAGPHSRSYHEDSIGGYSAMHGIFLVGGFAPLFLHPELSLRFQHPSNLLQNALTAITPFHVPERAREIALRKPFPYTFRKMTYGESYHENSRRDVQGEEESFAFDEEVYPGGWSELTTHLTGEYALGSASRPYVNAGHADSVMLRFRGAPEIHSMGDFRSLYTRGVYNGALPGEANTCHTTGSKVDASYLAEEGRCFTYQHQNRLIALYAPKRSGHRGVSSFRLDLCFTHFRPFDEILVDGIPIQAFPVELSATSRIALRDYQTYLWIQPLPLVPSSRPSPVVLRQYSEFLLISLYNYDGEERDFSRDEIAKWRSGFALEVMAKDEAGGWTTFLSDSRKAVVQEDADACGTRSVLFEHRGHRMEFTADLAREAIVSRRYDGVEDAIDCFVVNAEDTRYCPRTLFGREGF